MSETTYDFVLRNAEYEFITHLFGQLGHHARLHETDAYRGQLIAIKAMLALKLTKLHNHPLTYEDILGLKLHADLVEGVMKVVLQVTDLGAPQESGGTQQVTLLVRRSDG